MTSRMPERARTDPWEPQGSNPLGRPGPELSKDDKGNVAHVVLHREGLVTKAKRLDGEPKAEAAK